MTTTAARIARTVARSGGATMALDGTIPLDGYAVSLPGLERTYALATVLDMAGAVDAYAAEHADILARPGHYLGAWLDGDVLYLDVSRVIADRREAVAAGYAADQLAIFDLAAGEEIRLRGEIATCTSYYNAGPCQHCAGQDVTSRQES